MSFSGSDGIRKNIAQAGSDLQKSLSATSSGKRKLDPASIAVVESLNAEAAQVSVSSRNVADGASVLNTFESTVSQVGDILGRLGELAAQSANGTLSDAQRSSLNEEFNQLKQEVSRQTASTQFNGVKFGDQVNIEVGGDSEQLQVQTGDPAQLTATVNSLDISSQSAAQNAIDLIGEAATSITALKGSYGAAQSRLESVDSTLQDQKVGLNAAASRIEDADLAEEVANQTAASIRQQSAVTVLNSYKNISAQTVAKLLQ